MMKGAAAVAATERFSLTLASAVSEEDLLAWFRAAGEGERAVYASGGYLLDGPGPRLARRMANEGRAHLAQDRDPERPGCRRWWIEKRPAGGRPRGVRAGAAGELEALFAVLAEAAAAGRPCPSNNALARELALRVPGFAELYGMGPASSSAAVGRDKARCRAKYLLGKLEADGRIAIENRGTSAPRGLTVPARPARGKTTVGERS